MKLKEVLTIIPSREIIVGSPEAPVNLVIFGDYESQACAEVHLVIGKILEAYEGKVNFVFRHFPMTRIHQKAHKAAEASIGAAQEGKFWEMHSLLYRHRLSLGVISLKSYAREAGVKDKKFLDHLINGDWGWYVQDDLKDGINAGVTEIPALFINNVRFTKPLTFKNIEAEVTRLATPVKQQRKRA